MWVLFDADRCLAQLVGGETVHLQHPDLEISTGTQRGVVEGGALVRLTVPYVLVHPDRLALPVIKF